MNKRLVDKWSLVHILNGGLYGLLAFAFGLELIAAVIVSLVVAIVWEVYERFMHDSESVLNSLTDIGIASLGAVPVYFILNAIFDNVSFLFQGVAVVYAISHVCISFWFWWRYHKKYMKKKKIQKKYA